MSNSHKTEKLPRCLPCRTCLPDVKHMLLWSLPTLSSIEHPCRAATDLKSLCSNCHIGYSEAAWWMCCCHIQPDFSQLWNSRACLKIDTSYNWFINYHRYFVQWYYIKHSSKHTVLTLVKLLSIKPCYWGFHSLTKHKVISATLASGLEVTFPKPLNPAAPTYMYLFNFSKLKWLMKWTAEF